MKSWDVWDTLIGRWYRTPNSIFEEIEQTTGYKDFTWKRKHAENNTLVKTLDNIYKTFAQQNGETMDKVDVLKMLEISTEYARTFPILENVEKVKPEDIIVSDFYFSEEQLGNLLRYHKIPFSKIYVEYDGKQSGRFWNMLRGTIEHHTGDNDWSDFNQPIRYGIPATKYVSNFTELEEKLFDAGAQRTACLARAVRLSLPQNDIYLEQSQINIPLLLLISNYLHKKDKDLLFTSRDCVNLRKVYSTTYGTKAKQFNTSRDLYLNPTKEFIDYVKELYTDNSLIVDMQGTGKTCIEFFNKLGITPNYFTVVYSDLDTTYNVEHIAKRVEGFTDKIEKLNYVNLGKSVDAYIRSPWTHNFYIEKQEQAVDKAVEFLSMGFKVDDLDNEKLVSLIKFLLKEVEKNCVISRYVNHEEI